MSWEHDLKTTQNQGILPQKCKITQFYQEKTKQNKTFCHNSLGSLGNLDKLHLYKHLPVLLHFISDAETNRAATIFPSLNHAERTSCAEHCTSQKGSLQVQYSEFTLNTENTELKNAESKCNIHIVDLDIFKKSKSSLSVMG